MDIEFHSLEELKARVMPALRLRKRILKKEQKNLEEDDLWYYFIEKYWKTAHQLSLAQMVDDILNREVEL